MEMDWFFFLREFLNSKTDTDVNFSMKSIDYKQSEGNKAALTVSSKRRQDTKESTFVVKLMMPLNAILLLFDFEIRYRGAFLLENGRFIK